MPLRNEKLLNKNLNLLIDLGPYAEFCPQSYAFYSRYISPLPPFHDTCSTVAASLALCSMAGSPHRLPAIALWIFCSARCLSGLPWLTGCGAGMVRYFPLPLVQ